MHPTIHLAISYSKEQSKRSGNDLGPSGGHVFPNKLMGDRKSGIRTRDLKSCVCSWKWKKRVRIGNKEVYIPISQYPNIPLPSPIYNPVNPFPFTKHFVSRKAPDSLCEV